MVNWIILMQGINLISYEIEMTTWTSYYTVLMWPNYNNKTTTNDIHPIFIITHLENIIDEVIHNSSLQVILMDG